MGLDTSHGAWAGPYSAFNRWRAELARVAGGTWINQSGGYAEYTYQTETFGNDERLCEGFEEIMSHSDCDGVIAPDQCAKVADALEHLIPHMRGPQPAGVRSMTIIQTTQKFIAGCREAHERGEQLVFA